MWRSLVGDGEGRVMVKFKKKPVEIDAIKWTGSNRDEIFQFVGRDASFGDVTGMVIKTLEGEHKASEGDYPRCGGRILPVQA